MDAEAGAIQSGPQFFPVSKIAVGVFRRLDAITF
jgi:hypothetical protein